MKKFVKKAVAVVMTASMVFSLSACGGGQKAETPAAETTKAAEKAADAPKGEKGRIAYIVGALGDKSFSDSGEEGMKRLREQGWDCKTVEAGDETKADKWEDTMLDTLDEGYEYIVTSSTYRDVALTLAKEYPDRKFVIFDDSMAEADIPDNVALIFYAQNEGSYMVGQLAAGMSKSKVVAVNVGMDNPVIADFVTGFVDGVQSFDPECKVVKASVGSWTDPAKMKELCLSQARDKKADVFYQVAGGSGGGLFEACKENGTWAIGVDSDQYQYFKDSENPELADVILTSMLKNVGDS
ncbi:MAG: BMP family ABC transporter substrate-binding protein, partial [Hungatella sp.]